MKKTDDETKFIKSKRTKFAEFISKNSIYGIFAAVLVAVCTITIISLPSGDQTDTGGVPTPTGIADTGSTPNKTPYHQVPTPTPGKTIDTATPTPAPLIPTPTPDNGGTSDVSKDNENTFSIALPFAKNSIITEYSNVTPIYSDTLHEWACHVGIDFGCNENEPVAVAANGIVKEVITDDIYGVSVLVSHQDGFYTLYRGLSEAFVKADELVAKGQQIGKVAKSIPFEAHMPTHLHFELIKDKLSVNPISFTK